MENIVGKRGFLIREESGGQVKIYKSSEAARLVVQPGSRYQLLDAQTLKPTPVKTAYKDGYDLVLILQDGSSIVIPNYFLNTDPNDRKSLSEFEQFLPFTPAVEVRKQVYDPDTDDSGSWFNGAILGLVGIVLGATALIATAFKRSDVNVTTGDNNNNQTTGDNNQNNGDDNQTAGNNGDNQTNGDNNTVGDTVGDTYGDDNNVGDNNDQTNVTGGSGSGTTTGTTPAPSSYSITIDNVEGRDKIDVNEATDVLVSGTSSGLANGQVLEITIEDTISATVSKTAIVNNNTWTIEGNELDLTSLADGDLKLTVKAIDSSGTILATADEQLSLDTVVPEIVAVTAEPSSAEYFGSQFVNTELFFYVEYSEAVELNGSALNLSLNTGDTGATYVGQFQPDGSPNTKFLQFKYVLTENGEAQSSDRSIVPLAIVEGQDTKILGLDGDRARTTISQAAIDNFRQNHSLIYDLAPPEISDVELVSITSTGETVERQLNGVLTTLMKVNGLIKLTYTEPVVTETNGGTDVPSFTIDGLERLIEGNDVNTFVGLTTYSAADNSGSLSVDQFYRISDAYVPVQDDLGAITDVALSVVLGGFMQNNAIIIGDAGVPAKNNFVESNFANLVVTENLGTYSVNIGAGPFILDTVDYEILDPTVSEIDWLSYFSDHLSKDQVLGIISAKDINENNPNYLDEYTGQMEDLSSNFFDGRSLRSFIGISGDVINITPLTELVVRIAEARNVFTTTEVEKISAEVADFFGLKTLNISKLSFVNADFDETIDTEGFEYAIALAALSTLDTITGSIDATLNILSPLFEEGIDEQRENAIKNLIIEAEEIAPLAPNSEYLNNIDFITSKLDSMLKYVDLVSSNDAKSFELNAVEISDIYIIDDLNLSQMQSNDDVLIHDRNEVFNDDDNALNIGKDDVTYIENSQAIPYREWEFE